GLHKESGLAMDNIQIALQSALIECGIGQASLLPPELRAAGDQTVTCQWFHAVVDFSFFEQAFRLEKDQLDKSRIGYQNPSNSWHGKPDKVSVGARQPGKEFNAIFLEFQSDPDERRCFW